MTVTELRTLLQALEDQGHGALPVLYWSGSSIGDGSMEEPFDPEVRNDDGTPYIRI